MTTEELRKTTQEFSEEFVADKAEPLTACMRSRWEQARVKPARAKNGTGYRTIAVSLEKSLLSQCITLAKKKRISRDALIARGLKALLAAEGRAKKS